MAACNPALHARNKAWCTLCDWRVSFGQPPAPAPPKSSWLLTPTRGCSVSSVARSNRTKCTSLRLGLAACPFVSDRDCIPEWQGLVLLRAARCSARGPMPMVQRQPLMIDRPSYMPVIVGADRGGLAQPALDEDSCLSCLSVIYATFLPPYRPQSKRTVRSETTVHVAGNAVLGNPRAVESPQAQTSAICSSMETGRLSSILAISQARGLMHRHPFRRG